MALTTKQNSPSERSRDEDNSIALLDDTTNHLLSSSPVPTPNKVNFKKKSSKGEDFKLYDEGEGLAEELVMQTFRIKEDDCDNEKTKSADL